MLHSRALLATTLLTLACLTGCPKEDSNVDAGASEPDPVVTDAGAGQQDAGPGVTGPVLDGGGAEVCPTINPFNNIAGSSCRAEGQRCGPEGCIEPAPGACPFYICEDGVWVLEVLTGGADDAGQSVADAGTSDAGATDGGAPGTGDAGQRPADAGVTTDAG